jgi:hypothetical protein
MGGGPPHISAHCSSVIIMAEHSIQHAHSFTPAQVPISSPQFSSMHGVHMSSVPVVPVPVADGSVSVDVWLVTSVVMSVVIGIVVMSVVAIVVDVDGEVVDGTVVMPVLDVSVSPSVPVPPVSSPGHAAKPRVSPTNPRTIPVRLMEVSVPGRRAARHEAGQQTLHVRARCRRICSVHSKSDNDDRDRAPQSECSSSFTLPRNTQ